MKRQILALLTAVLLSTSAVAAPAAQPASPQTATPAPTLRLKLAEYATRTVKLRWNACANAAGYAVYRATGKAGDFELLARTADDSYLDRKVKKSKSYRYRVVAYTAQGATLATSGVKKLARANVFSAKLVNQTKLQPLITGHAEIDKKAKSILKKLITPKMTNLQKLKAIYNYCVRSFSYSRSPQYYITGSAYADKLYKNSVAVDLYYLDRAMTAFTTKKGACTAYSGAFVVLCNLAGFAAYIDEGDVHSHSGGYIGHTWTRVKFGGVYYIFDPQVEQSNMQDVIPYTYFAQPPKTDRYRKDGHTLKRSIGLRRAAKKHFTGGRKAKSVAP